MKNESEDAMVAEFVSAEVGFIQDFPECARSHRACVAQARRLVAATSDTGADRIMHKKGIRADGKRTRTNKRERLPDDHPLVLKWKREAANKKARNNAQ